MIIEHPLRRPDYYAASHWLPSTLLVVIVGGLAAILMAVLQGAQDSQERLVVALTVRNMRSGMQMAVGEALMHGRQREIADWIGGNPVAWLAAPPSGYGGACGVPAAATLTAGAWCFDATTRALLYKPRKAAALHGALASQPPCTVLTWRVAGAAVQAGDGGLVGLSLQAFGPCRWAGQGG